ncbi:unnamed protein product [Parascedosporium putredinis]|uniref:Rhodopsin domain-containing protein n=1 Tax=Parascedosporium putredinis TaxID=1442378 RepID=A0A9P1MBM9_9PEZI|nr:unnamed protein product [Parascedosporium putredinis]CAI7996166.1 unnamed protein product [Parascedosporium putredinis]
MEARPVDPSVKGVFWILISSATIFITLRLYYKYRGQGLHRDDLVLFSSWLALLANGIIITVILDIATSTEIPADPAATFEKLIILGLFSTTLALLSQAWSKTSFAMTLLGITNNRSWITYFLWFAIVTMNVSFVMSAVIFWIQCRPLKGFWDNSVELQCWNPTISIAYGMAVSAYSGILDLAFALLPWKILLPLNLSTKEKIGCAIAMSMGIFAAVAAFVKCSKFLEITPGGTGDSMQLAIWGVAEPAVTIIAASMPTLRLFVRKLTGPKDYAMEEGRAADEVALQEVAADGSLVGP